MDVLEDVASRVQELAIIAAQDVVLDAPEGVQEIVEVAVQVDALVTVEVAVQVDVQVGVRLDVRLHAMGIARLIVLTVVRVSGHEAVSSPKPE